MNDKWTIQEITALIVSLSGSWSQLCLVFIKIYYLYDVIDDVNKAEGSVPNYTASYWSVLFTLMNDMTNVYFEWPEWSKLGHMMAFCCQAVFNSTVFIMWGFFCKQ